MVKTPTKNSEPIDTFSQVAGYKPSIHNPVAFLHSMPNTEKETRSDPSTVATHTNQTPGNKPTKEKKDLYPFKTPENIKTLKKEIEEDDRRKRNTHAHGLRELTGWKRPAWQNNLQTGQQPKQGPKSFLRDSKTIPKLIRTYTGQGQPMQSKQNKCCRRCDHTGF